MKRFSCLSWRWMPVALVLVLALALPWAALADNVVNDVVVGGTDTFTQGGSTLVNYKIVATGGDGQSGCNASDGSPATVTINTPDEVTATPGELTFTACNVFRAVTFTASDDGDYEITVSVTDSGPGSYHTTPADLTLHVLAPADTSAPIITPNVSGTLGNDGWYVSDVSVSWTVTDDESTITSTSGCEDTTINTDTSGITLTCEATSAGGTSSQSVTVKRDATPPTIDWNGSINDGDSFYFGFVPAAPTCTAVDGLSGSGDCNVTGYGTSVGPHTLTATAHDLAANSTVETRSYTVLEWQMNGFYQPVDMSNAQTIWNTVKGGSTVPLKFEVFAGAVELTDPSIIIQPLTARQVPCAGGDPTDEIDLTATGSTSLRYDPTAGQFIFNWQTPKNPGACYQVTVSNMSGSSLSANFKLK